MQWKSPFVLQVNDPLWGATIAKAIDGKVTSLRLYSYEQDSLWFGDLPSFLRKNSTEDQRLLCSFKWSWFYRCLTDLSLLTQTSLLSNWLESAIFRNRRTTNGGGLKGKRRVTTLIRLCAAYLRCWLFGVCYAGWGRWHETAKVYDGVVEDIEVGIGSKCIKRDQWQIVQSEPCRRHMYTYVYIIVFIYVYTYYILYPRYRRYYISCYYMIPVYILYLLYLLMLLMKVLSDFTVLSLRYFSIWISNFIVSLPPKPSA